MAEAFIDLEQELDRLYGLPAAEFVARRNELAARLIKAGDRDAAGRVKKLPRPSLTAWAVNQLAFRAGAELEGLRAAGERVRAAHLAGPKEQRAAAKARREAISTLRVIAEVALQEAGTSPARSHRQRISQTLEVLSSQGPAAGQARAGRLSTDLEPAGFDALTDLAAALAAAQKERPRAAAKAKPAVEKPAEATPRPQAAAVESKVVEHPASKRRAELEARRAAADRAQRRRLDRRREQARAKLEQLEEKVAGLRRVAEHAASELDAAKGAEAALVEAAGEAERAAREARLRADAAAGVTTRARQEAEATSAARSRAEAEIDRARQELQDLRDQVGLERLLGEEVPS